MISLEQHKAINRSLINLINESYSMYSLALMICTKKILTITIINKIKYHR